MFGCLSKGVGAVDEAVGVVDKGVSTSRLMKHDWKEE